MATPPVPTPLPFRGLPVEPLDDRCGSGDCERWLVTECREVQVPSVALGSSSTNWANAVPLAAAGFKPECPGSPFFSRVNVVVPSVRPDGEFGAPQGSVPPPLHLEVRMGCEGAVSRVARVVWTPNQWLDFADVVQVSGLLVNRVELWGWAELWTPPEGPPVSLPYRAKFFMLIDRLGTGPVDVFVNPLANVAVDTS